MLTKYKILFCLFLALILFSFQFLSLIVIPHKVLITHPGISLTEKVEKVLFEVKNEKGITVDYYMDVETVVCGDDQCRIDLARIYWNPFGFFSRIELPDGVQLEKNEGKNFTSEDYLKLDQILTDRDASLKDVYKDEVVGTESSDGIDGISGATIILNTNDYVQGAVWSCYTLWHWVNGDIYSVIRELTYKNLNDEQLLDQINNGAIQQKIFALEGLKTRDNYSNQVCQTLIKIGDTKNYDLLKLILSYYDSAPEGIYFRDILKLTSRVIPQHRFLVLNSISKAKRQFPDAFVLSLAEQILSKPDYKELNLFLNILAYRKITSMRINEQLTSLLRQADFLSARRIYWHLREQTLCDTERKIVQDFYTKYLDKL